MKTPEEEAFPQGLLPEPPLNQSLEVPQGLIPEPIICQILEELLAEKIAARGSNWILNIPGVYDHLRFRWLEDVIQKYDQR